MSTSFMPLVNCSFNNERPSIRCSNYENLKNSPTFMVQPWSRALRQARDHLRINVSKIVKNTGGKIMDAFVDSVFEFVDQPLLPSQSNFSPVDQVEGPIKLVASVEGNNIPSSFPEGVYVRNGPNPLFGGLKSAKSIFGNSYPTWVEGEGMIHAVIFVRDENLNNWIVHYNNKYVETETLKLEKERSKPSLIPIIEGDLPAIISASLINLMRFGKLIKYVSNTSVFEHAGKLYSVAETYLPQEIEISTLETLGNWNVSGAWNRAFISHPKRVPGTGELVMMGMDLVKPFYELGIISADGMKLLHTVDLKYRRCTLCHDMGVTERYNVFMDFPFTLDIVRLFRGDQLMKYDKESYARIGVMPCYGDTDSIKWFEVTTNCTFHIINCFEDGDDEVVVWGCRTLESVIPGPGNSGPSIEKFNASIRDGLLHDRPYEWRLNMRTGQVKEKFLAAEVESSMDFPFINENFTGLKNKFAYTHVIDTSGIACGDFLPKFVGLAKLRFQQHDDISPTRREMDLVAKVEYHMFEDNTFCSGATFMPKQGSLEEDDGWIITFVHNESTNISQVYIIDTKKFSCEPITKIELPYRVPYGFHGAFIPRKQTTL